MGLFSFFKRKFGSSEPEPEDIPEEPIGEQFADEPEAPAQQQTISPEQQLESLKARLEKTENKNGALAVRVNELQDQVNQLQTLREQANRLNGVLLGKLKESGIKAPNDEQTEEALEDVTHAKEIEHLRSENAELNQAVDLLTDKSKIADEMLKDMRRRAAQARQELEKCKAELDESNELNAQIEDLMVKMTQVDSIIRKRDEKISTLTAENERLRESDRKLRMRVAEFERRVAKTFSFDDSEPEDKTEKAASQPKPKYTAPIKIDKPKITDSDLEEIGSRFAIKNAKDSQSDNSDDSADQNKQHDKSSDGQMSLPI